MNVLFDNSVCCFTRISWYRTYADHFQVLESVLMSLCKAVVFMLHAVHHVGLKSEGLINKVVNI